MSDLHIVVLAAGKGTRMKSLLPKVLHRIAGDPMLDFVLDTAATLAPRSITVVLGHEAEQVRAAMQHRPDLRTVIQEPQLGTAHALLMAEAALQHESGTVVLLSGDVPLLSAATLQNLVATHTRAAAAATVVTALADDPRGYGRVVRHHGAISRIVEHKDASEGEREIREINAGIYALQLDGLFDALRGIAAENAQREYYLPDLVAMLCSRGQTVATVTVDDVSEIQGINSRQDLAAVGRVVRLRKNAALMAEGVTIDAPDATYIDRRVEVGRDTIVHPGVILSGRTIVGEGCEIHNGARIVNSQIANGAVVLDHSLVTDSEIGEGAVVGPFAHVRQDSRVGRRARIGNFVELKKTALGHGSKSMHLTYLGDARIGERVNIGAGTITCNYDGVRKQVTTIEDDAFVGSDTQLIAPVTIGRGAYVGTGTTVREHVPDGALAVSAGKQRNLEGWVERKGRSRK